MNDLLDNLSELMEQTKVYYETYKQAKEREDKARQDLKEYMQSTGLLSAKTKTVTASIASKPTIEIKHEQSVLEWLRNSPDIEEGMYIGLKATPFKSMALAKMKATGETIDGTEVVMQEVLNIRKRG